MVSGAIGKHLHRFLRSAHRQHFFPGEPVMRRLEFCFRHGFSARAFLSPFFGSAKPDSVKLFVKKFICSFFLFGTSK